jgi:nitrogen regulatory protein PII
MDVIAIFAVVERGKADHLVEKAKKAGAKGATILYGRGTTKEVIIILAEKEHVEAIQKALIEAGRLDEPGTGILFSVPVLHLTGLKHRGLP